MQKLLTTLVIIFVSTSSFAEKNNGMPQSESSEDGTYFKQLPVVSKEEKNSLVLENEANNLELWKMLDTDNDDLLSITEASKSQVIYDQWSELDINKDNKLDFTEFSQKNEQEN